jgi:chromosome segregation ATPase
MTLDEIYSELRDGFKKVDRAFARSDDKFATIDDRFATIDDRFATIDAKFAKIDDEFTKVHAEFATLRLQMKAEGETTRRHFDVMVEKITDSVKIVAEATLHNTSRLDNHETRLKRLEKPRRS